MLQLDRNQPAGAVIQFFSHRPHREPGRRAVRPLDQGDRRMMKSFSSILFPTDFSACADEALEHCLGLARACGAKVTLLHVQIMLDDTPVETDRQDLTALLDRIKGVETDSTIARGFSAAEEILNSLRTGAYDLLVMGTHGRGWMGRMLLGSVASQMIRLSPVPVYTVREGAALPRLTPDHGRLAVPVDFSEGSQRSLAVAGGMASSGFSVMDVIHVVDRPDYPVFYPRERVGALGSQLEAHGLEKMQEAVAGHCPPGLRVEYHVLEGRPHAEIVRHATESGAGLVVIAGSGLGDDGPHLLGSTVEKVVAASDTAVLTVITPPAD